MDLEILTNIQVLKVQSSEECGILYCSDVVARGDAKDENKSIS